MYSNPNIHYSNSRRLISSFPIRGRPHLYSALPLPLPFFTHPIQFSLVSYDSSTIVSNLLWASLKLPLTSLPSPSSTDAEADPGGPCAAAENEDAECDTGGGSD